MEAIPSTSGISNGTHKLYCKLYTLSKNLLSSGNSQKVNQKRRSVLGRRSLMDFLRRRKGLSIKTAGGKNGRRKASGRQDEIQ